MFGLGFTELLLIAVVILLVVGPKRLPDVARSIGKGYGEFKRSFNDLKQSVDVNNSTSNNASTSSDKSNEKPHEQYVEKYKSQWEKKVNKSEAENKSQDNQKSDS